MTGEERILAIEHERANVPLDDVGVELDAAVVEEADEHVPVVQSITDGEWVAIQRLRKALWDALEADEAKQVENDEKGVAAADTPGLALCHVDAPR
jgi:hypothetical protein